RCRARAADPWSSANPDDGDWCRTRSTCPFPSMSLEIGNRTLGVRDGGARGDQHQCQNETPHALFLLRWSRPAARSRRRPVWKMNQQCCRNPTGCAENQGAIIASPATAAPLPPPLAGEGTASSAVAQNDTLRVSLQLHPPHLRHVDELPWRRHRADWHL